MDNGFRSTNFCKFDEVLGCPLPLHDHGASVSLPTWADVVGYEEGHPDVVNAMKMGYPRFKIHSSVSDLFQIVNRQYANKHIPKGHCSLSWQGGVNVSCSNRSGYGHTNFSWSGQLMDTMVYPTQDVARRFKSFLEAYNDAQQSCAVAIEAIGFGNLHAVHFPVAYYKKAKAFWQHTGEIISSRQAEAALRYFGYTPVSISDMFRAPGRSTSKTKPETVPETSLTSSTCPVSLEVEHRIASIVQEEAAAVTVTVSGMAAINAALRLVQAVHGCHSHCVVFGFPYLDTLKMLQRKELNPGGVTFLGHGDDSDLKLLEELLERLTVEGKHLGGLFCEFPTNPLLRCPNLKYLTKLASKYDFLLVVDDTVSGFINLDLLHKPDVLVDILCTSLTKAFSGVGNVLAGSVVVNSLGKHATELRAAVPKLMLPTLDSEDYNVLERNSRNYVARCLRMSQTALTLATWLQNHPAVARVYYPGLAAADSQDKAIYDTVARIGDLNMTSRDDSEDDTWTWIGTDGGEGGVPAVGYGCLLSVVLREVCDEKVFYDALAFSKGPSLGTDFTLACPYTLLAHYGELPWAATYGVSERLVRFSVGLEDVSVLEASLSSALLVSKYSRLWRTLRNIIRPRNARVIILSFLYSL